MPTLPQVPQMRTNKIPLSSHGELATFHVVISGYATALTVGFPRSSCIRVIEEEGTVIVVVPKRPSKI
jgi:hypothetical protein